VVRPPSSAPEDQGRFLPGSILGERYRIVSLLGRGGMGEVYRADDLKLGVTVALKFLPRDLREDPSKHERFLSEVRLARQISHPNVCRVFDVGEAEGQHFFSMEYIDGEDLASLLRRIGRLPAEKAAQIARQLCAGLAAAHELGILHRDLKPGNVMLDGRGRARITDFGLAALAGEVQGAEVFAGTPAYMAPEQLAGETVSVKSDLYALGLVLYELFTGTPAFAEASVRERLDRQRSATPSRPSSHVDDIDPAAERAILQCLEHDPSSRPASAGAVASALPGGDPLAAAMAAGETPSPELVAQAGGEGALSRPIAWLGLVAVVAALGLSLWVSERTDLLNQVAFPRSPQGLQDRAREMIRTLGYTEPPADSMYGFDTDVGYIARQQVSPDARTGPEPGAARRAPILFWYRQSPTPLTPLTTFLRILPLDDPPPRSQPGMVRIVLTLDGRLEGFLAATQGLDLAPGLEPGASGEPDVEGLFALAGLDLGTFRAAQPREVPSVFGDRRLAWEETTGSAPPRRIEATFWQGRLVTFESTGPWSQPEGWSPGLRFGYVGEALQPVAVFVIGFILFAVLAAAVLAHRNLRAGRGDLRGASTIAGLVGGLRFLAWVFGVHHAVSLEEWGALGEAVGLALMTAAFAWVGYLAVEPHFRRHWPTQLVTWSRLLEGRVRDPMVGRHLLLGLLVGLLYGSTQLVAGADADLGRVYDSGLARLVRVPFSITVGLVFASLPALLHFVLRSRRFAATALVVTMFGFTWLAGISIGPLAGLGLAIAATIALPGVLLGAGLLPMVVTVLVSSWVQNYPLTLDRSVWFFPDSMVTLGVLLALSLWAFYHALGGQPMFGEEADET